MIWWILAMNWPIPSTKSAVVKPPDNFELTGASGAELFTRIGISMRGWIYRSSLPGRYSRLLLVEDVPLECRNKIQEWMNTATPAGLVRISEAQYLPVSDEFYLVCYQISAGSTTYADLLAIAAPQERLAGALRLVRQFETWHKVLGSPILPMPADIFFATDGSPLLLPFPLFNLPKIDAVFAEPERGLYLAPEVVLGRSEKNGNALDIYAAGILIMQSFRKLPVPVDPTLVLTRAANGSLISLQPEMSMLPFWMERIRATKLALTIIRKMLAPDPAIRRELILEKEYQALESCIAGMDGYTAVKEMRQNNQSESAFALLQDVLIFQESYDLLLLGSQIVGSDLQRPLAALNLLEKAIKLDPSRPEAYRAHLEFLIGAPLNQQMVDLFRGNSSLADEFDASVDRDVLTLGGTIKGALEENLAVYLVWRGQSMRALNFIYPRLFEKGNFAFWKFHLNLLYAEALMGGGRLDEAEKQLESIRQGLVLVTQNKTFKTAEIHKWGNQMDKLRRELQFLNHPENFQVPPGKKSQ
jgi:tetratricopeptide (TPR) repeat protein